MTKKGYKPASEAHDNKPEVEEEQVETPIQEELGTEETQLESPPDETSEPKTDEEIEEKVDELAALKQQIEQLKGESEHVKEAMQKRIDEMTWQLKTEKERREESKERTWEDLTLEELKQYREHYRKEDNYTMIDHINDVLAEKIVRDKVDERTQLSQNSTVRVSEWNRVTSEYPELQDTNSEHYKRTLDLVKSDPRFDDLKTFPEGHSVAARLVAERLLRERVTQTESKNKEVSKKARDEAAKNALGSSSGKAAAPSATSEMQKKMYKAMNSDNPYGQEWKDVLKGINSTIK